MMKTFSFKKLSRDKVPSLMKEKYGSKVHLKKLDFSSYKKELARKLLEEALEVSEATSKKEKTEELGDLLEVIETLMRAYNIPMKEVRSFKKKKKEKLGSFEEALYIEKVEHPEGSDGETYCLSQPEKYPEI